MRRFSVSRYVLFVAVLLATIHAARSTASAQGTQVTGVVTVAGTGAPLEGARVTLLDPATGDTLRPSVYTDAHGRYALDGVTTDAEDGPVPVAAAAVLDAYPNPAAPSAGPVTIRFTGPSYGGLPAVELFDVFGRRLDPGGHLAGGLYFLRLRFDGGQASDATRLVLQEGGRLDFRLERVEAGPARSAVAPAGRVVAAAGFGGAAVFVVERDGYATVEEAQYVDPAGVGTHDFALTSYGLTLSRAERVAAVDAIFAHLRTIADRSVDEQNAALVQFLAARPEFRAAGVSKDRTVWAHFSDGLPVAIVNNRPGIGDGTAAGEAAAKQATPLDLPAGTRAFVMDVAGTGNGGPARVATMLREAGYEVAGGGVLAGTVEDFRSIRAAAVVHISSHGAIMQTSDGSGAYGIGTSSSIRKVDYDQCTQMTCDDRYWNEYYAGDLALGIYAEDATQSNPRGHWAVTDQFVGKYWSFTPESFLFLDACSSAGDDAEIAAFRAPLYRAKLTYFMGWNVTVDAGFAAKAASYFFDRVLGANSYEPLTPPQRPFPYRDVWFHMITTRRASFAGASMVYKQPGNDPGFLLPSIERITVFEPDDELWISGTFGGNANGEGRVTMAGQALDILEWVTDGSDIKVKVPPGLNGDVVVSIGTRSSNAVPLTRWRPTFRFKGDVSAAYDLPEKTLTVTVTCDVPFRADVHVYRDEPGEDPQEQYAMINSGRDLSCSWTATGSGTNPAGYKYTLSGSGTVEWDPEMMKTFAFSGFVDLDGLLSGGRRGIQLNYGLPEVEATLTVDPPVVDDPCGGPTDPDPYDTEAMLGDLGGSVFLDVDAGYGIVAGRAAPAAVTAAKQATPGAAATVQCGAPAVPTQLRVAAPEVEWDAAPATNAPKSTTKA